MPDDIVHGSDAKPTSLLYGLNEKPRGATIIMFGTMAVAGIKILKDSRAPCRLPGL